MMVNSVSFWEDLWRDRQQRGAHRTTAESIQHWDRRAPEFAAAVTGERGRRREEILHWLQAQGVSFGGTNVLDIGAGPGSFAVPLAKRVKQVTALEPSQRMLNYLEQRLKDEGVSNVETRQAAWEEIDLDQHGMRNGYDLVFASMCPGISSYAMVEKALAASREWCYISSFARRRYFRVLDTLLPRFGLETPSLEGNMLYLINLVYASGLEFTSRVWEETWAQALPLHEAAAKLCAAIEEWFPSAGIAHSEVEAAIAPEARGGLYTLETAARLGALLARPT